ncbi:hypothetical protein D3C80_1301790 [compost metagenome]
MLSEELIRDIATRYIAPIKTGTFDERRLMIENAIREALMEDYRQRHQPAPNAGCL